MVAQSQALVENYNKRATYREGLSSISILKFILDFIANQVRHIRWPDAVAKIFRLSKG